MKSLLSEGCDIYLFEVILTLDYSNTLDYEYNVFQKHACNPKHLYIKAFFLQGIKQKRGTS